MSTATTIDVTVALPSPDKVPASLWMLWTGDAWVRALDGRTDDYLAYADGGQAILGMVHQKQVYDIDCIPVRVK